MLEGDWPVSWEITDMRLITPLVGRQGLEPRLVAKANAVENHEEILLSFGRERLCW